MERPERYVFHMTDGTDSKPSAGLGEQTRGFIAEGDPERPAGKGERLAMAIRSRYRSTADFAREAGIPEGLVRQHIHRSTIPSKYLPTYTRFLKQSADWLLEGRGSAVIEPFAGGGTTPMFAAGGGDVPDIMPARVDKNFDLIVGSPPYAIEAKKPVVPTMTTADYKAYLQTFLQQIATMGAQRFALTVPKGFDREELRRALTDFTVTFVDTAGPTDMVLAVPVKTEAVEVASNEPLVGARDLPVYGVAQGGAGALQIDASPIEYVKRPAPLLGVKDAFAVYVVGDSMSPAYEQGDLILVHPGKPIERGLDALLCDAPEHGEWRAIVKRVDNWTEKVWRLTQFNPKKSYEVPKSEFPKAFRIVGKYNRR